MPYCQITDPFAEVYANNSLLVRFNDPPIDYSINQFAFSKTIYWDNQSLTKYYPEDITYSIENTPGLPYRIKWDTTQSYIIKNPTNYSYSFWWDMTCITYDIWIAWSRDYIYACNPARAANTTRSMSKFISFRKPVSISITKELNGYSCPPENVPNNNFYLNVIYNNGTCTSTLSYRTLLFTGMDSCAYSFTIKDANQSSEPPRQIIILDGGVPYTYPISNIDSVQVENSAPTKKININGTKYDLINENSIYITEVKKHKLTLTSRSQTVEQVYNTSPTIEIKCGEDCPPDTCKVECNDHYCCYNSLGNVVKTFPK